MADPAPSSVLTKKALAAAWATSKIGTQDWNNYCERFAENAYGTQGRFPSALAGGNALALRRELDKAQPGDLVYFSADDTNNGYGHVGVYVGNGQMVSATPTGVKKTGILTDRYYGPRFRGVADPPPDWQGQTGTPELVKGAQQIVQQASGGAAPVADNELTREYQRQADDAKARLDGAKQQAAAIALIQQYQADKKTPTDKWLADRNLTRADLAAAQAVYDRVDPDNPLNGAQNYQRIKDEQAKAQADYDRASAALAKAQADAPRPPAATAAVLNTDASDRYIIRRDPATGQPLLNADGTVQTIPNPNYRPPAGEDPEARAVALATAQTNLAAAQQRLTEATSPEAKARAQLDLEGARQALATAQQRAAQDAALFPGQLARQDVDLATARTNLAAAQEALRQATSPEAQRLAQIKVAQAEADLQKAQRPGTLTAGNTVYPLDPQTGLPVTDQGVDVRTPLQKMQDDLAAAETQHKLERAQLVKQLQAGIAGGTVQPADATAQLTAFDDLAKTNAERLAQQAQAEIARHNQAAEEETARSTNLRTASDFAAQAIQAQTAHNKEFLPASAGAGLQPLYDAFAAGKAPTGMGPTVFTRPPESDPMAVGQRVFESVLARLATIGSPAARAQLAQLQGQSAAPPVPAVPAPAASAPVLSSFTTPPGMLMTGDGRLIPGTNTPGGNPVSGGFVAPPLALPAAAAPLSVPVPPDDEDPYRRSINPFRAPAYAG